MEITRSYALDAPAEVVFSTLTDPARTARWMPPDVVVSWPARDRLEIRTGTGVWACEVTQDPERLGIGWLEVDGSGPRGRARVVEQPAGGSTVEVDLSFGADRPPAEPLLGRLDDVLDRLKREVAENFTPG
jgi:uncharacterized protein YndB with AHSA1/START domain